MDRSAPYLTHVITHHGKMTLVPPQNAGRIRKVKGEKNTPKKRISHTVSKRLDDTTSSEPSSELRSSSQLPITQIELSDIPSYPPPSFEEAMRASSSRTTPSRSPILPTASDALKEFHSRTPRRLPDLPVTHFPENAAITPSSHSPSTSQGTVPFPRNAARLRISPTFSDNRRTAAIPNDRQEVSLNRVNTTYNARDTHASSSQLELTDLDVWLSRLEINDDVTNGNAYNDFLTLSEFIGPADVASHPGPPLDLPVGKVENLRRRVLKDGRVKVKLSLLGVTIDKCSICLTQFKNNDWAALTACQHAFHEPCMRKWVVRSRTCPLCRQSMDAS